MPGIHVCTRTTIVHDLSSTINHTVHNPCRARAHGALAPYSSIQHEHSKVSLPPPAISNSTGMWSPTAFWITSAARRVLSQQYLNMCLLAQTRTHTQTRTLGQYRQVTRMPYAGMQSLPAIHPKWDSKAHPFFGWKGTKALQYNPSVQTGRFAKLS